MYHFLSEIYLDIFLFDTLLCSNIQSNDLLGIFCRCAGKVYVFNRSMQTSSIVYSIEICIQITCNWKRFLL